MVETFRTKTWWGFIDFPQKSETLNSSKTSRGIEVFEYLSWCVSGLHLILNINQAEYMPAGIDTAGIRLVIHSQERMPFPEDEGVTVSPGRATSIGMKQVQQRKVC